MKFIKATGKFFGKVKVYAFAHKIISILTLLVLLGGGYWLYTIIFPKNVVAQYELAQAKLGSIVLSVSGTGQVSASNQVDLAAKVSGNINYLNGISGQNVKEGELIAQIDTGTAGYELQNAQLSYQESLTNNQDSLAKTQSDLIKAQENYSSSYTDGLSTITSVSSKMLNSVEKMKALYEGSGYLGPKNNIFSENIKEQINLSHLSYVTARDSLKLFITDSSTLSPATSKEDIVKFLDKSYVVAMQISQATKLAQDTVINARNKQSNSTTEADAAYSDASSNASDASSIVSSISSAKNSIIVNTSALSDAQVNLKNLQQPGQNQVDVRSKLLSLKQQEETYSNYFIRAPFDGVIAAVNVQKGNNVNSGNIVATVITKKKIAEISLNEIDAAKVKVGQKATVTFDAIEGLSLSGEVVEVNLVGTVTQGVVNYKIKVGFDSEDDRIKPGMTASADIVINSADNVLVVPSSAIKTRGDKSFIQVVKENVDPKTFKSTTLSSKPQPVEVTVGITNDDSSEITSGLNEGDVYIVKTVTAATATTKAAPSLFGAAGVRTNGGTRTGGTGGSAVGR